MGLSIRKYTAWQLASLEQASQKIQREREREGASKIDITAFCNLVSEVISHYLAIFYSLKMIFQVPPTLRVYSINTKVVNTREQDH